MHWPSRSPLSMGALVFPCKSFCPPVYCREANSPARILRVTNQIIHPARTISGSLEVPAINPFRIATPCSRRSPKAPAKSRIFRRGRLPQHSGCLSRLGAKVEMEGRARPHHRRWPCRTAQIARLAGRRKFRHRPCACSREFWRAGISVDDRRRRLVASAGRCAASWIRSLTWARRIDAREGGFAPLKIEGTRLSPIEYALPVPSAQVKSSGSSRRDYSPTELRRSSNRSARAIIPSWHWPNLARASIMKAALIRIHGTPAPERTSLAVPGDLSSAVFFLAARWCSRNRIS